MASHVILIYRHNLTYIDAMFSFVWQMACMLRPPLPPPNNTFVAPNNTFGAARHARRGMHRESKWLGLGLRLPDFVWPP